MRLLRISICALGLLLSSLPSIAQNVNRLQVLEGDSITAVAGATAILYGSRQDSLVVMSDVEGFVPLSHPNFELRRIKLSYFGQLIHEQDLSMGHSSLLKVFVNTSQQLGEVSVYGKRKPVKHSLRADTISIASVPLFKNEALSSILRFIPGLREQGGVYTYYQKPVAGMRLGEHAPLQQLDDRAVERLKAIYQADVRSIVLKRVALETGIQYELIVQLRKAEGFSLTPTLSLRRGHATSPSASLFAQYSYGKFSNNLTLSLRRRRYKTAVEHRYTDGVITYHDYTDDVGKIDNIDVLYNASYELSKVLTLGASFSSYSFENVSSIDSRLAPASLHAEQEGKQGFYDAAVFAVLTFGKHTFRLEGAYNGDKQQGEYRPLGLAPILSESQSHSPNGTFEYTYTDEAKNLELSYRSSANRLSIEDRAGGGVHLNSEFVFANGVSLSKKWGAFSLMAGASLERSRRAGISSWDFAPNLSLAYEGKAINLSLDYSRVIQRPLAFMLTTNQHFEQNGLMRQGSPRMKPVIVSTYGLGFSWSDLYVGISHKERKGYVSALPKMLPGGEVSLLWANIGDLYSWNIETSYSYRHKALYVMPSIYMSLGSFVSFDGTRYANNYFSLSTTVGLSLGKHKLELSPNYIPAYKMHYGQGKKMFLLGASYTFTMLDDKLTLKLFAEDIFDDADEVKEGTLNGIRSYHHQYKDRRQVGISLSYRFTTGKDKATQTRKYNDSRL